MVPSATSLSLIQLQLLEEIKVFQNMNMYLDYTILKSLILNTYSTIIVVTFSLILMLQLYVHFMPFHVIWKFRTIRPVSFDVLFKYLIDVILFD
jgi:hypothetical protein